MKTIDGKRRRGLTRRAAAGAMAAALALAATSAVVAPAALGADAPAPEIDAEEGYRRAQAGELLLIDVRSPDEWAATGLPAGSAAITIHDPDGIAAFLAKVEAAAGPDKSRPVAFICATGVRSAHAQQLLSAEGYSEVYNLREGMFGSSAGPGWLLRGLPRQKP